MDHWVPCQGHLDNQVAHCSPATSPTASTLATRWYTSKSWDYYTSPNAGSLVAGATRTLGRWFWIGKKEGRASHALRVGSSIKGSAKSYSRLQGWELQLYTHREGWVTWRIILWRRVWPSPLQRWTYREDSQGWAVGSFSGGWRGMTLRPSQVVQGMSHLYNLDKDWGTPQSHINLWGSEI